MRGWIIVDYQYISLPARDWPPCLRDCPHTSVVREFFIPEGWNPAVFLKRNPYEP
jgi:hypothetical protein